MGITMTQTVDLNAFANQSGIKQEKALDDASLLVKQAQQNTIVANIKDFGGNLFSSINIKKQGRYERAIGPNIAQVPYAGWIEDGSPEQRGGFTGYHYVRNSIRSTQMRITNLIQRSLER